VKRQLTAKQNLIEQGGDEKKTGFTDVIDDLTT
jgi:hypothetical protein